MSVTVLCPSCKGKGHVLDAASLVVGLVFAWVLAPFERNNPQGCTREKCSQCKGSGFIKKP